MVGVRGTSRWQGAHGPIGDAAGVRGGDPSRRHARLSSTIMFFFALVGASSVTFVLYVSEPLFQAEEAVSRERGRSAFSENGPAESAATHPSGTPHSTTSASNSTTAAGAAVGEMGTASQAQSSLAQGAHAQVPLSKAGQEALCRDSTGPCLEQFEAENERSNPLKSVVDPGVLKLLQNPYNAPDVPVVQVFLPFKTDLCEAFLVRTLRQARSVNSRVYLIGASKYKSMAKDLGILWEPYTDYEATVEWFDRNYGNLLPDGAPLNAAGWNVKFFVMKLFMERHAIPRMFFIDSDVMLFANVTELAAMHFQNVPLALGYRWPSLQYRGPRHVPSVSASTHVSIWTYDALVDFLAFFDVFFREKVIPRYSADGQMISKGPYNDMTLLGWYTYKDCWMNRPEDLQPPCVYDPEVGFTPERTARLRGKFVPKYPVVSLNKQRWCRKTGWSNPGWCVFDNNFAARPNDNDPGGQTPRVCFKYGKGSKCPSSATYTYFADWSPNNVKQDGPVQFLGVHFQGRKKCLLNPWEEDSKTWACG